MTQEQFLRNLKDSQEPLRRFLLSLCEGDSYLADDIAQDASIRAWLGINGFRGLSKFSTWLFKIAYNVWYNRKYKTRELRFECVNTNGEISEESPFKQFEHQDLYVAISQLSPNEKAVILLFYMEDVPIKEISAIIGIPEGTIKSLLSRGRAKLKIKLDDR